MIEYIIDLKNKENMRLYYAIKDRFGEKIDNREEFIKDISNKISILTQKYSYIIIPESSCSFIEDIVKNTGKPYSIIHKRDKTTLFNIMHTLKLHKKEIESQTQRFLEMGDSFKINKLKSNQRKKYINYLFEHNNFHDKNAVIIDDSCFSGTTFEALKIATGVENAIFIFSK